MSKKNLGENYFLPTNYIVNEKPEYYLDEQSSEVIHQPDVYKLAYHLATLGECKYIIDIGSGNGIKLKIFEDKFKLICVDFGANIDLIKKNISGVELLKKNLEDGLPPIPKSILKKALIICSDVVEHLVEPKKLLEGLSTLSKISPFVLISTSDRVKNRGQEDSGPPINKSHIREWSLNEFKKLLNFYQFNYSVFGYTKNTNIHETKNTILTLSGFLANPVSKNKNIKILAIIPVFNENDIIANTISNLRLQGISVHIVDNWSNDGSYETVKNLSNLDPGISIERFPLKKPTKYFEWEKILKRIALVSKRKKFDWYIYQDCDEIRRSPWENTNLKDAISKVDELGFNAIDHTVLDFYPINNNFTSKHSIEETNKYFKLGKRPGYFLQLKIWKHTENEIDLRSSGGHQVSFKSRRIFPLKFLLKHYPLRSEAQSRKKIFKERLNKFSPAETKKGWHIQYNSYTTNSKFIWTKNNLILFNKNFYQDFLVERISGIGIIKDMANENYQDSSEEYLTQLFSNEPRCKIQNRIDEILFDNPSWPIFYHLSPIRENILSWYDFGKNKSILEIGAGCGAITGILCNKLKKVVANELSESRASIIRKRYKHNKNLIVTKGNLSNLKLEEKFDYVSLIGVLEYAGKYTHTENPFEDFLLKAKSYLKKNGTIIVAIENKFGLKYWSGCREDHTGRYFDSIENYSNDKEIQTFGKQEIIDLLNKSGFKQLKFYYPFPDYKLPNEIFSDEYLPTLKHNIKSFNFPYIDRSQNREYVFNEKLAMDNIIINKKFDFFANSFLIFAKA